MRLQGSAALAALLVAGATLAACGGDEDGTAPDSSAAPTATAPTTAPAPRTSAPNPSRPPSTTGDVTTAVPSVADVGPPARLDPDVASGLDAEGFADRLSASHAIMVDPSADGITRAGAGVDHQLVLRELAGRPDLDEAVLDDVAPSARPAVERVVRARQFLQERAAARPAQPLPDELPAWTIVEPEPVDTLRSHYAEAEQLTGIAWYWLAAIHLQETRMGRIQGVSSAGAVGPMQFLPTTWDVCCTGDPTVTRDAIIGAATYLAQSGGPDDMAAAVYEYNPNDGYVTVVTAYAENLRDEPELYPGYHGFQVFVGTSAGTVRLPVGYSESVPIDAASHLADHPADAA